MIDRTVDLQKHKEGFERIRHKIVDCNGLRKCYGMFSGEIKNNSVSMPESRSNFLNKNYFNGISYMCKVL